MLTQLHYTSNYAQDRYNFLKGEERYEQYAYVDSEGIPSIGIGYNLTEDPKLDLVLQTFGFDVYGQQLTGDAWVAEQQYMQAIYDVINNVSYTPNVHEPLRNALRQIMYARANDTRYGSFYRRDTFAFSSEAESKTVFDGIIESYETRVDNWLGYKMADSKERATLVSLAYNSVTGSTDLLGPKLKAAITNDNRAEAWYEIRYNSNGDRGHASRRYSESNMFNLYDSVFDEKGAKEVMRMYEKKQHSVFSHQLSA